MINASTHTRKIWRSHFDGADSTTVRTAQQLKNLWANIQYTKYVVDV
jgi:hypothetical protein